MFIRSLVYIFVLQRASSMPTLSEITSRGADWSFRCVSLSSLVHVCVHTHTQCMHTQTCCPCTLLHSCLHWLASLMNELHCRPALCMLQEAKRICLAVGCSLLPDRKCLCDRQTHSRVYCALHCRLPVVLLLSSLPSKSAVPNEPLGFSLKCISQLAANLLTVPLWLVLSFSLLHFLSWTRTLTLTHMHCSLMNRLNFAWESLLSSLHVAETALLLYSCRISIYTILLYMYLFIIWLYIFTCLQMLTSTRLPFLFCAPSDSLLLILRICFFLLVTLLIGLMLCTFLHCYSHYLHYMLYILFFNLLTTMCCVSSSFEFAKSFWKQLDAFTFHD